MLVGDAGLRGSNPTLTRKYDPKVCHRCMPKKGDLGNLNCAPPDSITLPTKFCEGGIRSVITFPTCWDGVNLDSADHKSHMSYPIEGSITDRFDYDGGKCPDTHPVKVPQVMYEVIWDVSYSFTIFTPSLLTYP